MWSIIEYIYYLRYGRQSSYELNFANESISRYKKRHHFQEIRENCVFRVCRGQYGRVLDIFVCHPVSLFFFFRIWKHGELQNIVQYISLNKCFIFFTYHFRLNLPVCRFCRFATPWITIGICKIYIYIYIHRKYLIRYIFPLREIVHNYK